MGLFDTRGKLLLPLEHVDFDNALWGISLSPSDFRVFSHRLLIGTTLAVPTISRGLFGNLVPVSGERRGTNV